MGKSSRLRAARQGVATPRVEAVPPRAASVVPSPSDDVAAACLGRLALVRRSEQQLEKRRRQLVVEARAAGCSWGDIGAVLGVTRQGALKVYGGDT